MKNLRQLTLGLALICGVAIITSTSTAAERRRPRDPGVNARQHVQQGRIAEGVKSGELTRQETIRLEREQKALRVEERAYKSDGKLTPAERKDLQQDLNKTSRDIYRQKHDDQTRPTPQPPTPAPSESTPPQN